MLRDYRRKKRDTSFCSLDLDIYSVILCLQYKFLHRLHKDQKAFCDRGQFTLTVLGSHLALRLSLYTSLHLDIKSNL